MANRSNETAVAFRETARRRVLEARHLLTFQSERPRLTTFDAAVACALLAAECAANDLAAFWYNLSYGNLLSGDNRSKIFDVQPLGHPSYILDPGVWFEDLYWKKRVISKGGLVERQCSYIVQFPNGAQLTFLSNYDLRGHDTNKEKGYNPSLELAITDAYAQSWKAKKVGTEPC